MFSRVLRFRVLFATKPSQVIKVEFSSLIQTLFSGSCDSIGSQTDVDFDPSTFNTQAKKVSTPLQIRNLSLNWESELGPQIQTLFYHRQLVVQSLGRDWQCTLTKRSFTAPWLVICIPSRPKLLQKILFKKNCFGTNNFVKIAKQSLYKANSFACSLANRDKPVAATLQSKCSCGIIFGNNYKHRCKKLLFRGIICNNFDQDGSLPRTPEPQNI